jgi:hypothetical protein
MVPLRDESRLMLRTMRDLPGLAALATDWVDDCMLPVAEGFADLLLRTRCLDFTGQATQQVRNLSLDLRPSMLDDLGLVATRARHPTEGSLS